MHVSKQDASIMVLHACEGVPSCLTGHSSIVVLHACEGVPSCLICHSSSARPKHERIGETSAYIKHVSWFYAFVWMMRSNKWWLHVRLGSEIESIGATRSFNDVVERDSTRTNEMMDYVKGLNKWQWKTVKKDYPLENQCCKRSSWDHQILSLIFVQSPPKI